MYVTDVPVIDRITDRRAAEAWVAHEALAEALFDMEPYVQGGMTPEGMAEFRRITECLDRAHEAREQLADILDRAGLTTL